VSQDDEPNKAEQQQQQVLNPRPSLLKPENGASFTEICSQIAAETAQRQLLEAELTRLLQGVSVISTALGRYKFYFEN
jgi:hypothetical protein